MRERDVPEPIQETERDVSDPVIGMDDDEGDASESPADDGEVREGVKPTQTQPLQLELAFIDRWSNVGLAGFANC